MKKIVLLLMSVGLLVACQTGHIYDEEETTYTQFVNPFIGSGGHGHVFVGANVPFGFVQLGPSQVTQGWDWCSGYHYSDSVLVGFTHLHLSGTGCADLGDIAFLPLANKEQRTDKFSHMHEIAEPGYYSVHTEEADVQVELTATTRTGFHRYFYPDANPQLLLVNLQYGTGDGDVVLGSSLHQQGDRSIAGYRFSKGWAVNQRVYFAAEFNKPIKSLEQDGDNFSVLSFESGSEPLMVKVGISAVSEENARLNLQTENPGWDFDEICLKASCAHTRH